MKTDGQKHQINNIKTLSIMTIINLSSGYEIRAVEPFEEIIQRIEDSTSTFIKVKYISPKDRSIRDVAINIYKIIYLKEVFSKSTAV